MGEPDFDAVAYALAYKFGMSVQIEHMEAVRHATLAARAAYDAESAYFTARFSGCTKADAMTAAAAVS